MIASTRSLSLFCCVATGYLALDAGGLAYANDFGPNQSTYARSDNRCAAYGPDFTAVDGGDTCIKIGGHVRVEAGSRGLSSPDSGWANGGMRPAGVRSGTSELDDSQFERPQQTDPSMARSHLRLRDADSMGFTDPFQR